MAWECGYLFLVHPAGNIHNGYWWGHMLAYSYSWMHVRSFGNCLALLLLLLSVYIPCIQELRTLKYMHSHKAAPLGYTRSIKLMVIGK